MCALYKCCSHKQICLFSYRNEVNTSLDHRALRQNSIDARIIIIDRHAYTICSLYRNCTPETVLKTFNYNVILVYYNGA